MTLGAARAWQRAGVLASVSCLLAAATVAIPRSRTIDIGGTEGEIRLEGWGPPRLLAGTTVRCAVRAGRMITPGT